MNKKNIILISISVLLILSIGIVAGYLLIGKPNVKPKKTKCFLGKVRVERTITAEPGLMARNVVNPSVINEPIWIQINVDYTTYLERNNKDIKWLDNVTMKYDVLLPKLEAKPRVVFSGEVTYCSLPMDGKEHHAQVFIHPHFFKRYAPDFKYKKKNLLEIKILVKFEHNGSPVGYGVSKRRSSEIPKLIKAEIDKALASPSTIKVKDAVFSRNKTPWGIVNQDYYELIKCEQAQRNAEIDYSRVERLANRLKAALKDEEKGKKMPAAQLKQFSKDFNLLALNPNIQELTGVKRHWLHAMSRITGQMSKIKEQFYLIQVRNDQQKRKELIGKYKILFNKCLTMADPQLIEKKRGTVISNIGVAVDQPQKERKRTPEEIALIRQKILERMAKEKKLKKEKDPNKESPGNSVNATPEQ